MSVTLQLGASQVALDPVHNRVFAGRDPTASQLAHLEPGLSRRHAELWLTGANQLFIRDLGSANGTWVNGQAIGGSPVALTPGMQVYLGSVPLGVMWIDGGAIAAAPPPPDWSQQLLAQQQAQAAALAAQQMQTQRPISEPLPKEFSYRRQGKNGNGVVLLALRQDTTWSGAPLEGFVEFTCLDNENIASIVVELVERHKKGPGGGHVWDRVLVRQGPWHALHGDVLPLPFQLDVPSGVSPSSHDDEWFLRALVDIAWATDVDVELPLTVRNHDLERIRDAMGALDYRFDQWLSKPHTQRFDAEFSPPAQHPNRIHNIKIGVEYLGATVKLELHIDKKGRDREDARALDLAQFRGADPAMLTTTLDRMINDAMG